MSEDLNKFNMTIKNYRCFADEKPVHITMGTGFTALVGINNSGKSSLLRLFYELRSLFAVIHRSRDDFITAMRSREGSGFPLAESIRDKLEIFCNANQRDIVIEIAAEEGLLMANHDGISPEKIVLTIPRGQNTFKAQIVSGGKDLDAKRENIVIKRVGSSYIKVGDQLIYMEAYYQAIEALSKTIYIGPFRNAVNIGGNTAYYDMTIGQQFIQLWDNYKSGTSKEAINAALKLTQDIQSIFGFNTIEINASSDNHTLHVIINGKPYRLEELGSGLAQFIVVLANIAIKHPSWVLIDEPELNLHPSLQLDFLTTLASYATMGIVFGTHNIGLARACSEQIYSFRLNERGNSSVADFETTPGLSEFLGELGYSAYHDLGYDKVLLVEGPTEIKTIQQFLRKYSKDHKIILLSLGGSNYISAGRDTELQEIKRITDNVFALIDSERNSKESPIADSRQAFFETCQKVGINCKILERRAIENYMSDRAVKVVKNGEYRALNPYEKLEDVSPAWAKQENWRIAREMSPDEIDKTDLGQFLRAL